MLEDGGSVVIGVLGAEEMVECEGFGDVEGTGAGADEGDAAFVSSSSLL
jgi:hypothetical protein